MRRRTPSANKSRISCESDENMLLATSATDVSFAIIANISDALIMNIN